MRFLLRLRSVFAALGLALLAVGPARAGVAVADAAEIQSLLKNEPGKVLILDVRTPGEWMQGIIPGATLIAMRDVPAQLGRIPRDKKIVVVCATGSRSGAVASYLGDRQGYPWVKNYAAGMVDWERRRLPVSRP